MTIGAFSQQTAQASEQALREAVSQHDAGNLHEAEMRFRAILQRDPNHPEANYFMGVLAMRQKQVSLSLPYFLVALNADPARGYYWLSYVEALFQTGQLEEARQILALARQHGLEGEETEALAVRLDGKEGVVERPAVAEPWPPSHAGQMDIPNTSEAKTPSPDRSGNQPQQAPFPEEIDALVALFNQGRFSEAITDARSMTEDHPEHWVGWKMLGVVFQQLGRDEDALLPMQKAAALSPGDAEAHNNLGIILQNLGRLNEAEASYRRALRINPDYAHAQGNLGATLQALGRMAEAEASYRRALQINPNYAKARGNLGAVLRALGRQDEAAANYRSALQINPNDIEVHFNLAALLRDMGQLDQAENQYRQVLKLDPDYAEVHFDLGNLLQDSGRLAAAAESYRQVLRIKPDFTEAHNNLGAILLESGRLDEAAASFRCALEIDPRHAKAHNNLGAVLLETGRLDEAAASFRRALEIDPSHAKAHNNLGAVLLEMGRLNEAAESYRRALEIKPDYAEPCFNLGHVLCDLDDLDRAAAAYQKVMDISPLNTGLDAEVYLAILHYLKGNLVQCRNMLNVSRTIMTQVNDKRKNVCGYWFYLDKLLSGQTQAIQSGPQPAEAETLYVIGESHSLSAHGVEVRYNKRKMHARAEWISGCKQWHLGNGKNNKYRQKFGAVMARIPRSSTVLLEIGEIDCRHDEGIIKVWEKHPEKELDEIARVTSTAYLNHVAGTGKHYGHRIIIAGVPAPNIASIAITATAAGRLVHLIRKFNATLKELALDSGMGFLDVYALTDRGDGMADGQWHIDSYHLLPGAVIEAFDKFCLPGIEPVTGQHSECASDRTDQTE